MTGSRIALLAFIVEVLIIYFKNFRLIFIPGIIITALVFIFSVIYPFIPREVPEDYRLRFENRSEIWTMSYLAGFDSPILGQGFGSAEEAINKKAFELNNFIKYQRIDNAHNLFLNWWIMGGGIGLIILILLISVSLRNLYQQKNWVLFSILLGLLMVQFFNPVSIVSLIHFWFILGLANS
jgi:O-antigen ligase